MDENNKTFEVQDLDTFERCGVFDSEIQQVLDADNLVELLDAGGGHVARKDPQSGEVWLACWFRVRLEGTRECDDKPATSTEEENLRARYLDDEDFATSVDDLVRDVKDREASAECNEDAVGFLLSDGWDVAEILGQAGGDS